MLFCRRETRSKKTSERSEEHPSGIGCLETASEESPLPPPSTGIRETRRSAAKKAQVIAPSSELAASDDLDSSKEEAKQETTTQNAASAIAENRRVSRLKEKEALGENHFCTATGTILLVKMCFLLPPTHIFFFFSNAYNPLTHGCKHSKL